MKGIYTALLTPFLESGEVDYSALTRILEQQTRLGIRGFVVCGTTGESVTLSLEEKEKLYRFVLAYGKGKTLDLVAGTGSNDTRESVKLTQLAESIGYRKFLIVVPYYNKPSQEGLRQHFITVANATLQPESEIILYNVPSRTGVTLSAETIANLASHPKIRAIKEASGDLTFLSAIQKALSEKKLSLSLLSGDDAVYHDFIKAGGHGVISVSSHVCPSAMIQIEKRVAEGNFEEAEKIQRKFLPIFSGLFIESNPTPLKWVMAELGLCKNILRLPLVPVAAPTVEKLRRLLMDFRIESEEIRK